jgi:hypothetical protein
MDWLFAPPVQVRRRAPGDTRYVSNEKNPSVFYFDHLMKILCVYLLVIAQ